MNKNAVSGPTSIFVHPEAIVVYPVYCYMIM